MNFEEQFPSLNNISIFYELDGIYEVKEAIKLFCLDKQKFKEAITKMKTRSENRWTDTQIEEFLLKELELGE